MTYRLLIVWSFAVILGSCARNDVTGPSGATTTLNASAPIVGDHASSSTNSLIGRFEVGAAVTSAAIAPPTNLVATVIGTAVTLSWTPPANGTAASYIIEAGTAPNLANVGRFGSLTTTFAGAAPSGTYYVRIRSGDTHGVESELTSNEVVVIVAPSANQDLFFAPPNPPNGQVGQPYFFSFCGLPDVNGANCAGVAGVLSGGVPPYRFQLDTAGGFPPIGLILAPNGALSGTPSAAVTNYSFRVCAVDATGVNRCSTVTITTAPRETCTTVATPTGLTAVANGSTVTVSWNRSPGATSYMLEAGTAPGTSNVFNGDVGDVNSLTAPGVPAGTYYLRVRARNACGTSPLSSDVPLTIQGGAPAPPPSPSGTAVSNVRIWLTGCTGRAPEPMPGWVNCNGYITMDVDADIRTGWIQVVMRFPVEGSFYQGAAQVGVGRIRRNVRVDIKNGYVSGCPAVPYNTFVGVSDGRPGIDPGAARFATVDVILPNCS
jgi:hypothetical protein